MRLEIYNPVLADVLDLLYTLIFVALREHAYQAVKDLSDIGVATERALASVRENLSSEAQEVFRTEENMAYFAAFYVRFGDTDNLERFDFDLIIELLLELERRMNEFLVPLINYWDRRKPSGDDMWGDVGGDVVDSDDCGVIGSSGDEDDGAFNDSSSYQRY